MEENTSTLRFDGADVMENKVQSLDFGNVLTTDISFEKPKEEEEEDEEEKDKKKKNKNDEIEVSEEIRLKRRKYERKSGLYRKYHTGPMADKQKRFERQVREAAVATARAEILLPSTEGYLEPEGIERTYSFSQKKLSKYVDERTKKQMFNLTLTEFGPYTFDYTRNGKHVLLAGKQGHIALFEWNSKKLVSEMHVKEVIRDVKFLHNYSMFAVAQKKAVYVYDDTGMELHELRGFENVTAMDFLPYHFLLATAGKYVVQWIDTSIGVEVAKHRTKLAECNVMRANPRNGVLCLGHQGGKVSMWSPNMRKPLVTMLCHYGGLTAMAIDIKGKYLVTAGNDRKVKVWDIRTYKELHYFHTKRPVTSMDISHTGLLGIGMRDEIRIWKDFTEPQKTLTFRPPVPYMKEVMYGNKVGRLRFCPYEDILGVGHSQGFSNFVIPGSGEPNFDTFEANPFITRKQEREQTVQRLLNKLQPDMITLDSLYGVMDKSVNVYVSAEQKRDYEEQKMAARQRAVEKKKKRGRGVRDSFKRSSIIKDAQITFDKKKDALAKTEAIEKKYNEAMDEAMDEKKIKRIGDYKKEDLEKKEAYSTLGRFQRKIN